MMLISSLADFFNAQGKERTYWLGYSGGLDSHVLMHLAAALNISLRVVHVNHHLHKEADAWAAHCKKTADALNIPFYEKNITLNCQPGDSLEEVAREKRYEAFQTLMQKNDILLTAHHQNDQAETLLLQLLRGSGTKGLSAMPLIKSFGCGEHARPLLSFKRADLKKYAEENKLHWIDDSSNLDTTFSRNFLRHEIMPLLETRFPAAVETISRSARLISEANHLLEKNAFLQLKTFQGKSENSLSVSKLLTLDLPTQQFILRAWMMSHHIQLPDHRKLFSICKNVLHARFDRAPLVTWGKVSLRRSRDEIFLMEEEIKLNEIKEWDFLSPLILDSRTLTAQKKPGEGLKSTIQSVAIRFRSGGETLFFPGRGHRSLKKMLNEWEVLPWQRDRLPLLYIGDVLASVVGFYIHPDFKVHNHELGWRVLLQSME